MKVVCDNCRAVYKVPDQKLTKAVNKATCRQCGHRMLIPKPRPGADPDERTLVTAVPPTPAGAPMRDNGPHTTPIDDEPEQTLPGRAPDEYSGQDTQRDEVPVFPGTPLPAFDRDNLRRPSASGYTPASLADTAVDAPPEPRRKPSAPPTRPRTHTPAPSAPRGTPAPAASRGTPAPAMARSDAYDPSGDMSWALLGAMAGLAGSFMLAFLSVFEDPLITRLVMWFGLAMSFGGGTLAVLVLLTGGRGRRPAYTLVSVVFGFLVAVISASTLVSLQVATTILVEEINFAAPNLTTIASTPAPAPEPSLASVEQKSEPEAADAGEVVEGDAGQGVDDEPTDAPAPPPAAAAAAPQPASAPRPAPSRSNDAVADAGTASAPAPAPAPRPAPAPPPAPPADPNVMASVPLVAVQAMLSNNLEVKKCFVPLYKAGALPPRVDVRVTILPTGQATNIAISQSQYTGSEFERCMQAAIGAITFPPSQNGTKITYPFILQ